MTKACVTIANVCYVCVCYVFLRRGLCNKHQGTDSRGFLGLACTWANPTPNPILQTDCWLGFDLKFLEGNSQLHKMINVMENKCTCFLKMEDFIKTPTGGAGPSATDIRDILELYLFLISASFHFSLWLMWKVSLCPLHVCAAFPLSSVWMMCLSFA